MARRITHGFVVDEEVELCGGEGPGGGAHHVDRLVQRVLGLQALDLRRSLGPDCKGKKRLIGSAEENPRLSARPKGGASVGG